jgi:ectoine hydroxylase-related dioxygenase (phytanoyl-CoA dioxygenase family)
MGTTDQLTDTTADLAALDRDGYVVIERAVDAEVLRAIRDELGPWLDDAAHRGRNDFEGFDTNRVYGLLAKVPSEAALVLHPRVLAVLDALLLPGYLLTANLAINLLPGETAQQLHVDDGFYRLARPRRPVSVSTVWAIDDFTAENGATEVVPGSHRWADELPGPDVELVAVEMPAGSVVIFLGTLWHRGGANRTDRPRLGITPQYCEPWARQQENMILAVGPAAAAMPLRLQELLGYSIHPPFMGHVDGRHPLLRLTGEPSVATGAGEAAGRFWVDGAGALPGR